MIKKGLGNILEFNWYHDMRLDVALGIAYTNIVIWHTCFKDITHQTQLAFLLFVFPQHIHVTSYYLYIFKKLWLCIYFGKAASSTI